MHGAMRSDVVHTSGCGGTGWNTPAQFKYRSERLANKSKVRTVPKIDFREKKNVSTYPLKRP